MTTAVVHTNRLKFSLVHKQLHFVAQGLNGIALTCDKHKRFQFSFYYFNQKMNVK